MNKIIPFNKNIEFNNDIPIYVQLVQKIKIDIFAGRLKPSDKLPSVRDFAIKFKVNPNTIQKALNVLELEKLIFTERTNGKFVTDNEKLIARCRNLYAKELEKEYKSKMKEIGITIKEEFNE